MTIIERVVMALAERPGLTARDLVLVLNSEGLEVKKSEVNTCLYSGSDMFRRDEDPPRWYLGPTGQAHNGFAQSLATGQRDTLVTVTQEPQFDTKVEDLPGAAFFRVDQRGGNKILCLNRSHPFFTSYDNVADKGARLLIDTMLVSYGDSELEATGDRALWFQLVRDIWSQTCRRVLRQLSNERADEMVGPI